MADKDNCKKFYRCVANEHGGFTKYDFECPEGTAWSQELETCDYADAVTGCVQKSQSGNRNAVEIKMEARKKEKANFFCFFFICLIFKIKKVQVTTMEEIQAQPKKPQQQVRTD